MLDHPWSNSFTKISRKPKRAPSPLNNGPTWYVGWCCGFWMLIWKKGRMFCKWPYLVLLSVDMLELFWGLNFLFFSRTVYWLFSSLLLHSLVLILIIYYIFFIWNAKYLSTFWVVAYNMWWNLFLLLFVKRVSIWVVAISKEIKIWFKITKCHD